MQLPGSVLKGMQHDLPLSLPPSCWLEDKRDGWNRSSVLEHETAFGREAKYIEKKQDVRRSDVRKHAAKALKHLPLDLHVKIK